MEQSLAVPQKPRKSLMRRWLRFLVYASIVCLALFIITYKVCPPQIANVFAYAAFGTLLLIGFTYIFWIFGSFFLMMKRSIDVVFTPIPTPAEIGWQLSQEWGRPATVEEVAAVHQMLTSEHNQALLATGIGIAALYAMNRAADGKPIL